MKRFIFTIVAVLCTVCTQAKAGIVVENGIVISYTNSGTTYYFHTGSISDHTDLYEAPDSTTANAITFDLRDALNSSTTTLSTAVEYAFRTPINDYILFENGSTTSIKSYHLVTYDPTYPVGGPQWDAYGEQKPDASTSTRGNAFYWATLTAPPTSDVPEPSTAIAMGLLGVVGFAGNRRRRRQVSAA